MIGGALLPDASHRGTVERWLAERVAADDRRWVRACVRGQVERHLKLALVLVFAAFVEWAMAAYISIPV